MRTKARTDELVPLIQRVRTMQLFRSSLTVGVLFVAALAPEAVGARFGSLVKASLAYLLIAGVAEALWRWDRGRNLLLFGTMLIIDGLFLAWLTYVTGGVDSPIRNLIVLHLIAVTLLASYRTGLKLAMWHSLLLLVVHYAEQTGVLSPPPSGANAAGFHHLVTFIVVFWLVALACATFSAINERELRRRRFDLEALAHLASLLEGSGTYFEVADTLLVSLMETFDFKRGVVLGREGDGTRSVVLAVQGGTGSRTDYPKPVPTDHLLEKAWRSRKTQLVRAIDSSRNPNLDRLLPGAQNIVIVPLTAEVGPVGAVVLEHALRTGSRIERRVVTMVERFCSHGALAIRNSMLVWKLRQLATTDSLTQVANRHTFENTLSIELQRAARGGRSVTLVMIDIDHFKELNDQFGHQAGDQVLRVTAATLRKHCRPFDTLARYGGEEFAVLLPECDAEHALESAERFRMAVKQMPGPKPVTVSVGVATFPTHSTDAESLIKRADTALYESKRAGRDRVSGPRETLAQESVDRIMEAARHDAVPPTDDPSRPAGFPTMPGRP